jgi:hypothetical protein
MKLFSSLLLIAAAVISASAQSPDKILKTAQKALGGEKVLLAERSVSATGRVTRLSDGATGNYTLRTAEPAYFSERFEINGFEIETGTNGRSSWERNSRDGLRTLTGEASIEMRARAAYLNHLWLERKREKSKASFSGQAMVDGRLANVVTLTTIRGVAIKIYIDPSMGLPVRDEFSFGSQTYLRDHGDYRPAGVAVKPFLERVTHNGETYEIRFDSIETNKEVDLAFFNFPVISKEPLPYIRQLLIELQANEDRIEAILDTYSFTQKIVKRELQKDGVLRETGSETYQMSFYKGNRIKRLIEKDAKPLNQKEQDEEDREVAKRVTEIDKRLAKLEGKPDADDDERISIAEMLRASNLINPRRERFRGRDVIVFDFEPNPAFDYKNAKSILKLFGKTTGVMWIDEKDKQVARLEASLSESYGIGGGLVAKLKKGASFSLEQERVNDEIWLPTLAEVNMSVRVLLLKGIDVNQIVRSYNYRKFQTEVKDAKVDDPQKP